jgi:hypothetical protein
MQARHKYRDAYLDTPARNHTVPQWNTVAAKAIIVVCNTRKKTDETLKTRDS